MNDSRSQKCDLTPCFLESNFSKSGLFLEGNFLFLPEEGNLSEMSSGEESENEQNSDMELDTQE